MKIALEHDIELNQLFALRLCRETADAPWRAVLRSAASGERIAFADMEHLTVFLLRLMEKTGSQTSEQNTRITENTYNSKDSQ